MSVRPEGVDDETIAFLAGVRTAQHRAAAATSSAARRIAPAREPETAPSTGLEALLRTGEAIARYVLSASVRRQANDANLQFALALGPLWREAEPAAGDTLSRALITVQGFARTAETRALNGDGERIRLLLGISDTLRDSAFDTPWYPHLLEGDRWGDVLGYQAPTAAARATTVWRAVSDLGAALEGGVAFPPEAPPLPDAPVLPLPSTARARVATLNMDALWAAPAPPTAPEGTRGVEVWFGTTRAQRPNTRSEFGPERADALALGRCQVTVPAARRRGSVGSTWWQKLLRFDFRDDSLTLQSTEILGDSFVDALGDRLRDADDTGRVGLLYVHGYNTSFEDAAIRTAQLAVDLDFPGVAGFFSWPSRASAVDYIADISQAEWSWEMFVQFVQTFRDAGIQRLDVIVHSMGNRVLSWAMERLAEAGSVPFGSVFLAAADLDPDIFRQRLPFYRRGSGDITLYVSKFDRALGLSRFLHQVGRLGLTPPTTVVEGAWTIDASRLNDSFLGHGYYADQPRVLTDIAAALHGSTPPQREGRDGLVRVEEPALHWELV